MSSIEKQCVICGESCVGQPRIRNEKGQYAHRSCAEAKQTAKPEPMQNEHDPDLAALGFDDDGFGDMSDLLPDTPPEPQQPALRAACPSCGTALDSGVVVCLNCGYNTASGKALKTKAKDKNTSIAGGAMVSGVAGKAGGASIAILMPILGALIAGAIGASVWAGMVYLVQYELGWVAIAIGVLVAFGAVMGARGESTPIIGLLSVIVTVAAILVGKYVGISLIYENEIRAEVDEFMESLVVDETWFLQEIVDELALEQMAAGRPVIWPNPNMSLEYAEWPDDYPRELRVKAQAEWDEIDPLEQTAMIEERQAEIDVYDVEEIESEMKAEGFRSTFGFRDFIFFGFAILFAYKIGSYD